MALGTYLDHQWFTITSGNVATIILLIFLAYLLFKRWFSRSKYNFPKGPMGFPLLGYLPLLGKEPHKVFDKLKEKYGGVYSVRLGQADVIILADYAAVQEALSKQTTTDRPPGTFDFLPGGFGFGGSNGAQWLEGRKFAMKILKDLGLGRTRWATLVEEEISVFLGKISNSKSQPINIHKLLAPCVANSILSMLFGKRFSGQALDSLIVTSGSVSQFFAPSGLWNYFPWLCIFLRKLTFTPYHKMFINMLAFNKFFRDETQNHKQTLGRANEMDFVSEYLEFLQNEDSKGKESFFNEKLMIGDAQTLFVAGSDTTRTALHWLFLLTAAFPEVQNKVYNELQSVLEKQQILSWEDRSKLPYTVAVIMEAQRCKTVAALTVPRMASEDMKIFDYDIPKGTFIITNSWSLHNDTRYWKKPEKFIPERFLISDGKKVNMKPESYVPFSFGKRKCPGELVAMMGLFLYYTAVIRRYEVRIPRGKKPDLDGTLGLVCFPNHQDLCFIPREQIL